MELSSKTYDMAQSLATWGVGGLAWMYTSTAKWEQFNNPYTLKQRLADAVGNTLGKTVAKTLFPDVAGDADLKPNLFGWVNKTVGAGALLEIGDKILAEIWSKYDKMSGLRKIVDGVATGLIFGGAIGGVFDPEPKPRNQSQSSPPQEERVMSANPWGR
jgi:hypothetical protein